MACHDDVVVEFLTPFVPLQVDFSGYEGIQTLGADRVANALAASQYRIFPVIAVDMGTATTFDVVVEREGRLLFSGGMIAPGLAAFSACLNGRTALLPVISSAEEQGSVIGSTTQEAMAAAVRVGYPALVDGILDEMEKELGEPAHVVLTGGDAALIGPRLRRKCIMEPMLTLNGIARAFGMHL